MYTLSRTIPVNEPGKPLLSRHDVWVGLEMKANNALPFVPIMQKCEVIERGAGWLTRDILLKGVPLREKVSFEPEKRVIFERIAGSEPGRIENIIGEDEHGNLTLTFSFSLGKEGLADGSRPEVWHWLDSGRRRPDAGGLLSARARDRPGVPVQDDCGSAGLS